jgi:hypothetical protein
MTEPIQVSPEAEAELLQIMKENDSQIIPEHIFKVITEMYPIKEQL